MGFFEDEPLEEEEIDFGSQLSIGSKGMLINDNWITWQIDKSGYPHHDNIAERYYKWNIDEQNVKATYWFDGILSVFSLYPLFDERTQIPLRNVYGSTYKVKLSIEADMGGESFNGTYAEYKKAEQAWEEQNQPVSVAWVRSNCRFAKRPARFVYPTTQTTDEDEKYEQARTYFDLGHGEETEHSSDPESHVVWVLDKNKEISTAPGIKTHGMVWGHDFCNYTWKGRYEGDTGRLSIVAPDGFPRKAPSWLLNKLEQKFSFISEVHEFN